MAVACKGGLAVGEKRGEAKRKYVAVRNEITSHRPGAHSIAPLAHQPLRHRLCAAGAIACGVKLSV